MAELKFDSNNITNGVALTLNGVKFTAGGSGATGFAIGATTQQTVDNLVAALNSSTNNNVAKATYSRIGTDTLKIETKVNGANNNYSIAFNFQQDTKAEVEVKSTNGITQAATGSASGTIASLGNIGTDAINKAASAGTAILKFDSNQITAGAAITLNGVTLTAGATGANGFAIGSTLSTTLDNLATALNNNSNANLQKATYV